MEEKTYTFLGRCVYDKAMYNEVNRAYQNIRTFSVVMKYLLALSLAYYIAVVFFMAKSYSDFSRSYLIGSAVYLLIVFVLWLLSRNGGIHYKRMLSNNGGRPMDVRMEFSEEGITVSNEENGNRNLFRYDQVRALGQTERYLLILLELQQFLPIRKDSVEGGSLEELTEHLKIYCPKLRPKRLKNGLAGKIGRILLLVVWLTGMALAVYASPLIQNPLEARKPINDTMTVVEIAEKLKELDLTIAPENLESFEEHYGAYYAETDMANYSKVTDLLYWEGAGYWDDETETYYYSENGIYWFEMNYEPYDMFLEGISLMDKETLDFTDIAVTGEDGPQGVSFLWDGQTYTLQGRGYFERFDKAVGNELAELIEQKTEKSLWFLDDGGYGYVVFYRDDQWAESFEAATGLELLSRIP